MTRMHHCFFFFLVLLFFPTKTGCFRFCWPVQWPLNLKYIKDLDDHIQCIDQTNNWIIFHSIVSFKFVVQLIRHLIFSFQYLMQLFAHLTLIADNNCCYHMNWCVYTAVITCVGMFTDPIFCTMVHTGRCYFMYCIVYLHCLSSCNVCTRLHTMQFNPLLWLG